MDKRIFEGIQYFISLTQLGSISLVAKEMNTDYKTIKQKINYLEKSINKQLVNSSYQGTALTEEGWGYYHSIISGYNLFNSQVNDTTNESLTNQNILNMLLQPMASLFIAIHVLPDLLKTHPDLSVNITTFDLAYLFSHGSHIRSTINQFNYIAIDERLLKLIDQDLWILAVSREETQRLYASEEYLKGRKISNIHDIHQADFIGRTGTVEDNGLIELRSLTSHETNMIHFKNNITANNDILKAHLANRGVGITLLNDFIFNCGQNLNLVNILPEYISTHKFTYHTLYRTNDVNAKYIKSITNIIKDKLIETGLAT